jgi:hypothetical protein
MSPGLRYWISKGPWRGSSRHMLRSWWCCCVASAGSGLGRHSHSLALLGLTLGAGDSRFKAAPAELFSACVLSPYISSGILPMLSPDTQGLRRVLLRQRTDMSASSLPLLLYKTLEVEETSDKGL